MSELAETKNENVLPGSASVHKPRTPALLPVLQTEVVELFEILRNHERRDAVFQTFLEENQSSNASVSVLKRMYLLETDMEVE